MLTLFSFTTQNSGTNNFLLDVDLSLSIDGDNLEVGYEDAFGNLSYLAVANPALDLNNPNDRPLIALELDSLFNTTGCLVYARPELDASGNVINTPAFSPLVSVVIPHIGQCVTIKHMRTSTDPTQLTDQFQIVY